jgi:hypothetical protein
MQRTNRSIMLVGLVFLCVAGTLSAQVARLDDAPGALRARRVADDDSGMGAFLEWLHKLSGPRFIGVGLSGYYAPSGDSGIRLRLSGVYRTSVSESGEVTPADANITMITVQPAVEFPVQKIPIDFGVGFALHRFGGDAEGFWHYSVPIYAQFRPRGDRHVTPVLGIGVHIFPKFDPADFAPLTVTVSRQDSEAVLQLFGGVSIRP